MKISIILVIAILLFSAYLIDRRISRKRYTHYLAQQQCISEFWDKDRDPNYPFVFDVEGVTIIGYKEVS